MLAKEAFAKLVQGLEQIYAAREANNIVQYVFEDAFQIHNAHLSDRILDENQLDNYKNISSQLLQKRPWQYVLGEADFYGLKMIVDENVLIPRAETEELVYWIKERHGKEKVSILDIGTGSGCIPIALQKNMPLATVSALDVDPKALAIAQRNAKVNQATVLFMEIDILEASQWANLETQNILVSNPPYIPIQEKKLMPDHVLEHEPHLALFTSDENPLIFYEKIASFALQKLLPSGWLYFEINEFYGQQVLELLEKKGFKNCQLQQDLSGRDRMVCGQIN